MFGLIPRLLPVVWHFSVDIIDLYHRSGISGHVPVMISTIYMANSTIIIYFSSIQNSHRDRVTAHFF